jgi:glycosyltransferase involved in cell wall biosynthesis
MNLKLIIISEIISPYRIPVFNSLSTHHGLDLHVIFLAETDPTQREWAVYKDEMKFSYQVLPSWRRRYAKRNVLLNRGMSVALERVKPDVIVCGGYNYLASWQALAWARKNRVPFLAWVESTTQDKRANHRLTEFLKKIFMSRCQAFVVPGKSSLQYVRDFDISEASIFVAPNAVDTEFFARKAAHARAETEFHRGRLLLPRRYFLYVGRLVKEKGIRDLIEAYEKLSPALRREIGLVFVGNGSDKAVFEHQVSRMKCGTVKFVGFVQREELPYYYALSEACVLPTHSDPWGLVVNEAMACGLPIIVTDVAGCAMDLVEDRWNGFVTSACHPDGLAHAMESLVNNQDMKSIMSQHSQERILRYSPQSCAAGIASAVRSLEGLSHA